MIGSEQVQSWLDAYGEAWRNGDPDAVVALFSSNASYFETPFGAPMVGHSAIRNYWREGAQDSQRDVQFSAQVWSCIDNIAVVGWRASFIRVPSGNRVSLDGVFHLQFDTGDEQLLCTSLREWWHRNEQANDAV